MRFLVVILILSISTLVSATEVDIEYFSDHGETGKNNGYLLHFRVIPDDDGYDKNVVYVTWDNSNSELSANANGIFRLEITLESYDNYQISIGNMPYQGKDRYWEKDQAWSSIHGVYGEESDDKIEIASITFLPYPEPSIETFLNWSKLSNSEWNSTMISLGLNKKGALIEGCQLYSANKQNFAETYNVKKCDNNYIEFDYGVFSAKSESDLDWVKTSLQTFKESLAEFYIGPKAMGPFSTEEYKFKSNGTTYSIILLEDSKCIMEICLQPKVYIRWQ